MKEPVIADTGFWIALFDGRDKNHIFAKSGLKFFLRNYHTCVSDFIIFETVTYLSCSVKRHDLAVRFLNKITDCNFKVLRVDEFIKNQSLELFIKYSDKAFSFTDCTSFAIMRQNRIRKYAGFDKHFQQMGFISVVE